MFNQTLWQLILRIQIKIQNSGNSIVKFQKGQGLLLHDHCHDYAASNLTCTALIDSSILAEFRSVVKDTKSNTKKYYEIDFNSE